MKDGSKLMMMGTAEVLVAPTEAIKFVEDLPEDQQAHAAANDLGAGSGLVNMGNTCYMNATLQCLKSVPELRCVLYIYLYDGFEMICFENSLYRCHLTIAQIEISL